MYKDCDLDVVVREKGKRDREWVRVGDMKLNKCFSFI